MVLARCGNVDDLAAESLHKRRILTLRVDDDNVGIAVEHQIGDLALACERFTGTGNTEDERITVEQIPAVGNDHVIADSVLTVVDTALMPDLLYLERHKYRKAFGSQGTKHIDLSAADGKNGIQTVHLLIFQNRKLAQMPSCGRKQSLRIGIELFFGIRRVNECDRRAHHALVAGCQVIEEFLALFALQLHIIGNDGRKVVVLILLSLPVGDIGFHAEQPVLNLAHRFIGRDGDHINRQHQVTVQLGQLRYHTVLDIRRVVLHKENADKLISELHIIVEALDAVGTDIVFEVVSLAGAFLHIEVEIHFLSRTVEVVENAQALRGVQIHTL